MYSLTSADISSQRPQPRHIIGLLNVEMSHVIRVSDASHQTRFVSTYDPLHRVPKTTLGQHQISRMFKPFKPPLLRKVEGHASIDLTEPDSEEAAEVLHPPYKKRRLIHIVEDSPSKKLSISSSAVNAPRKPLLVLEAPNYVKPAEPSLPEGLEGYYMVLWYASPTTPDVDN